MRVNKKVVTWAVAVILVLSLLLIPAVSQLSPARAAEAEGWTEYSGNVTLKYPGTLEDELYVVDAWVIKDGSTYKMWYTHGKRDLSITEIAAGIEALNLDNIINDIVNLNLVDFLGHLSGVSVTAMIDLLGGTSTVIGCANSTDGKTWTVVDSEVLAGSSGGAWTSVGAPCVVKTDSTYEMWYTAVKTDLTEEELNTIVTKLGNPSQRQDALLDLLDGISTVIKYATSDNGTDWTVPQEVLAGTGAGAAWNSVGDSCVVKTDATTYEMWYTAVKTDVTAADLAAITDVATFNIGDLLGILDGTSTVIGYATSDNGTDWTVLPENREVLAGNGTAWNSVANPSVVMAANGTYEMWYTRVQRDLTTAAFRSVLNEIAGLANSLWNILKDFAAGDLGAGLTALAGLDISTLEGLLGGTSTVIEYTTSDDGINWGTRLEVPVGGSGAAWSSVAAPSVVKTDATTYDMWYTEGIDEITLQSVVDLVQGTDLPIGYASCTLGATVEISIVLQGDYRPDAGWVIPITVKFFTPEADLDHVLSDTPLYSDNWTTVKTNGTAAANITGIPPGNYDITVVSDHTLINVKGNVTISAPYTAVDMGTLNEGDADASTWVNIYDFDILLGSFMKAEGHPDYNPMADFDRTTWVNIYDFDLMLGSFFTSSPLEVP